MNKKVRDFIEGSSDVMPIPEGAFLHREVSPNGMYFMTLKIANGNDFIALKSWWENPKKPAVKDKGPPKHTGGKKAYLMVMTEEVERLKKDGVKNIEELLGYLTSLGSHIEWNTGRLIHKRSKEPLRYKDLMEIFRCGNKKLNRLLADMKEHELLYLTDGGYVVSSRLIKKGKMNKQREGD